MILKQECKQLVDWNRVDKDDYLSAMQRSEGYRNPAKTGPQIHSRNVFMLGIDVSCCYEGYSAIQTGKV